MSQNPNSPPETESEQRYNDGRCFWWQSKAIFLFTNFVLAVLAFYYALADNVFSTPYLEPHIGVPMFTGFITWAVGFAAVCTVPVALMSLIVRRIKAWHYTLLPIPFVIEFAITWYFFVAFFGI